MSLEHTQLNELHWLMEMLHNIDVGLVVLDRDYNIQIWNGFMESHSGLLPGNVKDQCLFDLFDEVPQGWFTRKAESVFLLKNKAFTIWEQRPYLFRFDNYRPITGTADFMYQNVTFIPLKSSTGEVTHLCLIIYDVTDTAVNKLQVEKANQELCVLSQTDGLTRLFNRVSWENQLSTEFKRWQRTKKSSSLVMLDIDHFKSVNDQYGHVVGDEVIRHLAALIKHHSRETDTAGRYGGEEFAIILTETDVDNSLVFAERLRKAVESSVVRHNDIELKYTISIGIAEISDTIKAYEQWIEFADTALYLSKDNGRNQATLFKLD